MALEVDGTSADARFTILLNRAERVSFAVPRTAALTLKDANRGYYDQALGLLLGLDVLEGMGMEAYRKWATCVKEILRYKAELRCVSIPLDSAVC
jgi:hypothetical protein